MGARGYRVVREVPAREHNWGVNKKEYVRKPVIKKVPKASNSMFRPGMKNKFVGRR